MKAIAAATQPVACNLGAFDAVQKQRYEEALAELRSRLIERRELTDGWAFVFPSDAATCILAMEFVTLERQCCPFWTFRLEVTSLDGPLILALTGPADAKEILADFLV